MKFQDGLTCSLGVADIESSARWYASTLGFELLYSLPDGSWGELTTPLSNVTLGLSRTAARVTGESSLIFGVSDIDAAQTALNAMGVETEGPIDYPGLVRLLRFHDPDGNRLAMAQDLRRES